MASKTINNLDPVSDISVDDLLIIGQGSLGKKASISEFFAITPGIGSGAPNIPFITYDRLTTLTEAQKSIARSNLGIDSQGSITNAVNSVNGFTGDPFFYLDSFQVSQNDSRQLSAYIENFISEHNTDLSAHASLLESYATLQSVVNSIKDHNDSTTAHATEIGDTITNRLQGYATEVFVNNKLESYAETSDLPTKLSELTDDIHYVSYDSQSGYDNTQKGIARANIGAIGTITSNITGQAPLTGDSVQLTAAFIGAVPTTRTVNSKALSQNITLNAGDVGAVPTTRTINSKSLSTNITLNATDVGAVPSAGGVVTGNLNMGNNQSSTNLLILNNAMYGSVLPATGVAGQFFFLYT